MNTDKVRTFLGGEYEEVIRYDMADAFADSVKCVSGLAAKAGAAPFST